MSPYSPKPPQQQKAVTRYYQECWVQVLHPTLPSCPLPPSASDHQQVGPVIHTPAMSWSCSRWRLNDLLRVKSLCGGWPRQRGPQTPCSASTAAYHSTPHSLRVNFLSRQNENMSIFTLKKILILWAFMDRAKQGSYVKNEDERAFMMYLLHAWDYMRHFPRFLV